MYFIHELPENVVNLLYELAILNVKSSYPEYDRKKIDNILIDFENEKIKDVVPLLREYVDTLHKPQRKKLRKIYCPECGKELIPLEPTDTEFWCCGTNFTVDAFTPCISTYDTIEEATPWIIISNDTLKVELEWIGEGNCGDYNRYDPKDRKLMRFYVYSRSDNNCEYIEKISYCTQLCADDDVEKLLMATYIIFKKISELDAGSSLKKLGEELSWISVKD